MNFEIFKYSPGSEGKEIPLKPINAIPEKTVLQLYAGMLRLRLVEEALIREYHPADEMRCPIHFCVGQEAVPTALSLLVKKEDFVYSHHRSHGYYLSKSKSLNPLFAELYGKETGADGGKAGSQDISMAADNFFAGAILAGAIPIAAGTAMTFQNRKQPYCAISGFGEGATDEGVFWETMNYAAVRKLPLVLLCENNLYATYSPQTKRSAVRNIAERVHSFGVSSRTIFGNDVVAAYQAINEAFEQARSGKGPVFIEAFTYRWNAHVGPENDDHIGYRPEAEIEFWKANCPIKLLEKRLSLKGMDVAAEKDRLTKEIEKEIAAAFEFAKKSPFPAANTDIESYNWSKFSPLADKYLEDQTNTTFDETQAELIPAPY
jgi:TPP-dependent pyruvate/acetoin dehydrogenase alpha subunit